MHGCNCLDLGGELISKTKKIDTVVLRETLFIAIWTVIFSAVMEAVFLIIGRFDYTVPLGNLLGAAAAVLNFFLMGLSVQIAVEKDNAANDYSDSNDTDGEDEKSTIFHKEAKQIMRLSQTLRNMMLLVFAVVGVAVPCFHPIAVLIPLLFPRIAIMLRPMFGRRMDAYKGGEN